MERSPSTLPTVTIVVVPRERFSHARRALDALYANTDYPFELVYVDGNSPPELAAHLRAASAKRGFRLIRVDRFLAPNEARNIGFRDVQSDFVVFVDNDCEVQPGWLGTLVCCAVDTGATAVAPLYLEGTPGSDVVHMAGGYAHFMSDAGVRRFVSEHVHAQRRASELALAGGETELFEFHCVLIEARALRDVGGCDERLLSNHEHEDLALRIREAGGRIRFEPAARVTYTLGPLDRHDIEYASLRWSDAWNRQSSGHFARKWRLPAGWGEKSVNWCNAHRERLLQNARQPPAARVARVLGRAARRLFG